MPQSSTSFKETSKSKVRTIGIVAYDGMDIIDLTGPLEVFSLTNLCLQLTGIVKDNVYPHKVLAKNPGLVASYNGLQIHADCAYGDIQDGLDTLIIPGAPDFHCLLSDPSLQDWVRVISPSLRRLVSVCTGAFLIAELGFLDGRRATTHWAYCDRFSADYPSVVVEQDRIFVRDNFISTSGGITSGIDLALSLVEEDWGREVALTTARYMVVYLRRPGGQTQFSPYLVSEGTNHSDLRALQMWVIEHPAEDLRIEVLAGRMAMSPRNFSRVFQVETGITPAKFVEKVRVDAARHYLGEADVRIETVAVKAGFGDSDRMRKAFIRNLNIGPKEYRARFGPDDHQPLPAVTDGYSPEISDKLSEF